MTTNGKLLSSIDGSNAQAIDRLLSICFPDGQTILDPTYGNGSFYHGTSRAPLGGDKDLRRARHYAGDYEHLPFGPNAVDVVVFDPPFQPDTKNGLSKVGQRFTKMRDAKGGYGIGAIPRLKQSVQQGAHEAFRVCRKGCIIKVQDYIHSGRPVWMSMWVWEALGEPYDFLTLRNPKMCASSWVHQLSVWRNHSTFWVYRKDSPNNYHILRTPSVPPT